MGVLIYEGVIDHGQIRLRTDLRLPDNTKVYIVIPGDEIEPEAAVYNIRLAAPGQEGTQPPAHIYSPHLAPPGRASDLKLEIIEETPGADL